MGVAAHGASTCSTNSPQILKGTQYCDEQFDTTIRTSRCRDGGRRDRLCVGERCRLRLVACRKAVDPLCHANWFDLGGHAHIGVVGLFRARRRGVPLLLLCVVYWFFGSTFVASRFVGLLEADYRPVDPPTAPTFDVVVVLGGANFWDDEGHVWLSPYGDRLMLALRLYHQGRAKQLVTTGRLYDWYDSKGVNMSEATERIWTEAGIPADRITQVGGTNTSREMVELRKLLGDNPPAHVGLLTSAFHMPSHTSPSQTKWTGIYADRRRISTPQGAASALADSLCVRSSAVRAGHQGVFGGVVGALNGALLMG